MTRNASEQIPVGLIGILRDELADVEKKIITPPPAVTRRAGILRQLLDELIERRESDAIKAEQSAAIAATEVARAFKQAPRV